MATRDEDITATTSFSGCVRPNHSDEETKRALGLAAKRPRALPEAVCRAESAKPLTDNLFQMCYEAHVYFQCTSLSPQLLPRALELSAAKYVKFLLPAEKRLPTITMMQRMHSLQVPSHTRTHKHTPESCKKIRTSESSETKSLAKGKGPMPS